MSIPHSVDIPAGVRVIDVSDPTEVQHGEWVDLPTASLRLGISERSIYRRITRGTLTRRTGIHGRVEVWLPVDGEESDASLTRQYESRARHSEQDMHAAYMERIAMQAEEIGRLKAELERIANGERERRLSAERRRLSIVRWIRRFFMGGGAYMTLTDSASTVTKPSGVRTQIRSF